MHLGSILVDEHISPFAPAALMAPVRLFIRPHLTNALERAAQTRREYPC
jgi:hypothetical protein